MTNDELTRRCTAFDCFQKLIDWSLTSGWAPSLYPLQADEPTDRIYNFRRWELCETFDRWMETHGFHHRAWRGSYVQDRSWTSYSAASQPSDRDELEICFDD